jgi:hypothetical protein
MKVRHSSEHIFFDLMAEAAFSIENTTNLPLPGDDGESEETIDVFHFQYSNPDQSSKSVPKEQCTSR